MIYIEKFLQLKCCSDVLNVCGSLGKNSVKEISESMGMLRVIKGLFISHPVEYNLIDLCSGNALTSVLAVHLLPVDYALAVDKNERIRNWHLAKRFFYQVHDIYDDEFMLRSINENSVIICVHGCKDLARRIIEIYTKSEAKALFMMPCCNGKLTRKYPQSIIQTLGNYKIWCWDLLQDMSGENTKNIFIEDKKILSPKNVIVGSVRGE